MIIIFLLLFIIDPDLETSDGGRMVTESKLALTTLPFVAPPAIPVSTIPVLLKAGAAACPAVWEMICGFVDYALHRIF